MTVLNIGCGNNDEFQAQTVIEGAINIDIRGSKLYNFMYGSGEHLPFKANLFDSVYCIDVIEHIESPGLLMRDVHRVLKTGGKVVVGTPNACYGLKTLKAISHGKAFVHYDHINTYGKSELENLFRRCGFRNFVVTCDTYINGEHTFLGSICERFFPKSIRRQVIGVAWKR